MVAAGYVPYFCIISPPGRPFQIFKAMNYNILIPVFTAFGGIILGAIVSIFSAYFQERVKRSAEAKAVTLAIVTEIRVSLFLAEKRQYLERIQETLTDIQSGKIAASGFRVVVSDDYCPIFKSNLQKIGLLPSSIRDDVVAFYQLLEAAVCDVRPGGLLAENQCGEKEFSELFAIATEAMRVGKKVIGTYPD